MGWPSAASTRPSRSARSETWKRSTPACATSTGSGAAPARRRILRELGGAAQRAEGEAHHLLDLAAAGGDPLRAAAADVDHGGGAGSQVHHLAHRAVDELPLLDAGQELHVEAGQGLDA